MCFTPLVELFLQRMCAENGLDEAHCKSSVDGAKNPSPQYKHAQEMAAKVTAVYQLLVGFPAVATSAFFGCLGDAFGRRLPLLIPCFAALIQAVAFAVTPTNDMAIMICMLSAFGGGIYVNNLAAFSTLADVTRHASPKERAVVFGIVESFLWVGLLVGPVVGGVMVRIFGNQHAFFANAVVASVQVLVTWSTYPETLEAHRRRKFSWRRANPFVSLCMFCETKVTFLLAVVMLFALTSQTGGVAMLSLYALKVANLQPTMLGLLQSTILGASVFGLMLIMPILLRCISLRSCVVLSCLDAAICWFLMSLVVNELQFFVVGASLFLAALYFPIARCGMTNTFGKERYGEALAAVGVMEQTCGMIGTPIVNGIYQATLNVEFTFAGVTVHSVACLGVAAMYFVAMIAGLIVPPIPHEKDNDGFQLADL